jgi:subtilisin family serine protease
MRPELSLLSRLISAVLCAWFWTASVSAADLVLRPQPQVAPDVICARYGFALLNALESQHLYLVAAPDTTTQATLDGILAVDKEIQSLEFSTRLQAPPLPSGPGLTQSIAGILETYTTTFVDYFGASAWDYYVTQNAANQLRLTDAHKLATGSGVIAIIDTGVDPTHPALEAALVEGYDFTRDLQGFGSEWSDLPPELSQSIAAILEGYSKTTFDGSTYTPMPAPLPEYFGHGTMVAGIIRLTAPTSRIMPLKAFTSEGSTTLYNIIRAIYYAADHGAQVINMSFITLQPSKELSTAITYASRKGIIAVAAVGNNGWSTDTYPVYPADYRVTFGIGSTLNNKRSKFSNYGIDVKYGAPGESLLTTYPGNLYALVSGTSFSAGWASGSVGLFLQRNPGVTMRDVDTAFANGATKLKGEGMGGGRIDIYRSTLSVPLR